MKFRNPIFTLFIWESFSQPSYTLLDQVFPKIEECVNRETIQNNSILETVSSKDIVLLITAYADRLENCTDDGRTGLDLLLSQ